MLDIIYWYSFSEFFTRGQNLIFASCQHVYKTKYFTLLFDSAQINTNYFMAWKSRKSTGIRQKSARNKHGKWFLCKLCCCYGNEKITMLSDFESVAPNDVTLIKLQIIIQQNLHRSKPNLRISIHGKIWESTETKLL